MRDQGADRRDACCVASCLFIVALDSCSSSRRGRSISGQWPFNPVPFTLYPDSLHPVRIVRPSQRSAMHLRLDRDVPVFRRYLGALIETSDADVVLALHIDSMGRGAGARLRGAAGLFHLHHSLDAAAGFLAVDLHRLRRRGRAVCMAMFYHPAGQSPIRRPISIIICRAA